MAERRKARVLWVTFHFPPRQSSGVFRPAKLYKYLDKSDLEIDFLTLSPHGKYKRAVQDPSLLDEIAPAPPIYRVPSPEVEDAVRVVLDKLRGKKQIARWTSDKPSEDLSHRTLSARVKSSLKGIYRLFIMLVLFPDQYCIWGWLATMCSMGLFVRRRYDLVYTSSNPQSAHLPGLALQVLGAAWVADYRDGGSLWNAQMMRYPKGKLRRRAEHLYQRTVMQRADRIVTQSEGLKEVFRQVFDLDGDNMRAIPNGFDESDFSGVEDATADVLNKKVGELHLLHVGVWYLDHDETLQMIADLNALHEQLKATGERLVFHGVGYYELFTDRQKTENVQFCYRYHGPIAHRELMPYLMSCDCYLLSASLSMVEDGARGVLAGKLWEYLRGGKPVLLFGPKDEAWRILAEAGVGVDMSRIQSDGASVVRRLRSPWSAGRASERRIQRYSWEARADAMQQVFRSLLDERGS